MVLGSVQKRSRRQAADNGGIIASGSGIHLELCIVFVLICY
jgi:hypothetical protein